MQRLPGAGLVPVAVRESEMLGPMDAERGANANDGPGELPELDIGGNGGGSLS